VTMEKYLTAGDGVAVMLPCSKPSETKTTGAYTSAARSSYQPSSSRTACLVLVASLLNLSRRVTTFVSSLWSFFFFLSAERVPEVGVFVVVVLSFPFSSGHPGKERAGKSVNQELAELVEGQHEEATSDRNQYWGIQ